MSTETCTVTSYVTNRVSSCVQTHTLPKQSQMSDVLMAVTRADMYEALPRGRPSSQPTARLTQNPHSSLRKLC